MSSLPTSTSVSLEKSSASWLTLTADFVELTKPRISVMVLVAVAVAAVVASWGQVEPWQLMHVLVATGLVAASASAANQWLERHRDALMNRTANRPLPAGRLRGLTVLCFSAVTLIAGTLYLLEKSAWPAAVFGLATWVLYVMVYTPLKALSPWNTGVGAVAGALPVFIGWTAVGAPLGWRAVVLFSIIFLWQFPHFMAIAWIYRDDYRRAGLRMLTVVEPTGRLAGMHAVLAALALLPVSIAPALVHRDWGGVFYATSAFALSFGLVLCSLVFLFVRSDAAARILLRATLIYLPGIFLLLLLTPLL